MNLHVRIIPILHNNYTFLVYDEQSKKAVCIDPGEASPIQDVLSEIGLRLTQIWVTHYHYDHCEGAESLAKKYDALIYGPESPPKGLTVNMVSSKDTLDFCGEKFQIMDTLGHVPHHIAFYNQANRMLFPGDTLFGCGAAVVINDHASRLWKTMQKFRILPDATRVYFSHEVTARNIRFALSLDPDNEALKLRYNFTKAQIRKKRPTCPSMLQMEKETNPFLRADDPVFQKTIGKENENGENVFMDLMHKLDKSYGRI